MPPKPGSWRFLKKSPQFVIPIYQRTYSWTERECRQLWDDIVRTGKNDAISAHFVGSIVYIERGLYQVSGHHPLLVIDGQQRLTTVMLILEAVARHLGEEEPVDGFSAKKLRNYYLLNSLEEGERGFKLILTQTDKQSLLALMQQKPLPAEHSIRIADNFAFFEKQVRKAWRQPHPLVQRAGETRDRGYRSESRPGQPPTDLREHELDGPRTHSG